MKATIPGTHGTTIWRLLAAIVIRGLFICEFAYLQKKKIGKNGKNDNLQVRNDGTYQPTEICITFSNFCSIHYIYKVMALALQ
jgi:hypothetical protein